MDVRELIRNLAERYKYRPLPKEMRDYALHIYETHLNGFDDPKPCRIDGVLIADKISRVVIGDYGAYVEIAKDDLKVELTVPENQTWRFNTEYIERKQLTLKYHWYEYNGVKVYFQLGEVKYADYKPGFYYISVLDFD